VNVDITLSGPEAAVNELLLDLIKHYSVWGAAIVSVSVSEPTTTRRNAHLTVDVPTTGD